MLITAEDDLADTIRPRLDAAGADVARIVALDSVTWRDDRGWVRQRPFELADVEALRGLVARTPDCRLLVIDPVSAFVGGHDSHNNAEIRALLAPLAKLAEDCGVAVVAVTHLSKGAGGRAVYRAMGSLAFVAAARCAWLVARDRQNPERRLFLPVKNNLADDQSGLAYGIVDGALAWEQGAVTVRADDVLGDGDGSSASSKPGPEQTTRAEATAWLREILAAGPIAAAQVQHEAEAMRFAIGTLRRAKEELAAKAFRPSPGGPWFWRLPVPSPAGGEPDNLSILRTWEGGAPPGVVDRSSSLKETTRATTPGASAATDGATSEPQATQMLKMRRLPGSGESTARPPALLFHGPFGLPDVR